MTAIHAFYIHDPRNPIHQSLVTLAVPITAWSHLSQVVDHLLPHLLRLNYAGRVAGATAAALGKLHRRLRQPPLTPLTSPFFT